LLESEFSALTRIKNDFEWFEDQTVWRYATHVGEKPFIKFLLPRGWYLQK
jgi:hypothetical protein